MCFQLRESYRFLHLFVSQVCNKINVKIFLQPANRKPNIRLVPSMSRLDPRNYKEPARAFRAWQPTILMPERSSQEHEIIRLDARAGSLWQKRAGLATP